MLRRSTQPQCGLILLRVKAYFEFLTASMMAAGAMRGSRQTALAPDLSLIASEPTGARDLPAMRCILARLRAPLAK